MAGRVAMQPKSFGVATMPWPKWYCQMRLTITRAVSGFSGSAIQPASSAEGCAVSAGSSGVSSGKQDSERAHSHAVAFVLIIAAGQQTNGRQFARTVVHRSKWPAAASGSLASSSFIALRSSGLSAAEVFSSSCPLTF